MAESALDSLAQVLPLMDGILAPEDKKAHLLVVDDDPQIVKLCRLFLANVAPPESAGVEMEIHTASSGEEALAIVERLLEAGDRVACALVDVMMPDGMDGIETISRIWEVGSGRSVFISGRTVGQLGLSRILYHGPSLLRVLYAYYQDLFPPTLVPSVIGANNLGALTVANAHNVKVEHAYGTVAQYVHVASRVEVGQRLARGDEVAVTARNGFICRPHLHLGVYRSRRHLYDSPDRESVPLRFAGIEGERLREGVRYLVP